MPNSSRGPSPSVEGISSDMRFGHGVATSSNFPLMMADGWKTTDLNNDRATIRCHGATTPLATTNNTVGKTHFPLRKSLRGLEPFAGELKQVILEPVTCVRLRVTGLASGTGTVWQGLTHRRER